MILQMHFSKPIPDYRLRCIESVKAAYPDEPYKMIDAIEEVNYYREKIRKEYGVYLPVAGTIITNTVISDWMRFYFCAENDDIKFFGTDVELCRKIDGLIPEQAYFGGGICLIISQGQRQLFGDWLKDAAQKNMHFLQKYGHTAAMQIPKEFYKHHREGRDRWSA
jgi:hypothetical protein